MKRSALLAVIGLLSATSLAHAQFTTGNVYGTVTDESGGALPGATAGLSGATGTRTTTSGDAGEFRFLGVEYGSYELTVSISSFATVRRAVIVTTAHNLDLAFRLPLATVEEELTVLAETPVLDTRKVGTSTTLTNNELHRVPNSRDPWALLRTIPGVVLDRMNIAGNESGQQSLIVAKGADPMDTMWYIDGVFFEDPQFTGTSPGYHDPSSFEEIAFTTGGSDIQAQTGGLGLHFVTKRGTNQWHGSARGFLTHDDLQWSNVGGTELEGDPRLQGSDKADHIQQIADYGFDVGGPIVKDKLFIFGSYGVQDIRLVRTDQTADKTLLKIWNAKLNWQISPSTMASVFYYRPQKIKKGRSPGFGLQWDDDALWDQEDFGGDLLPVYGMVKFEVNHVFNPSFFMNLKYTNRDGAVSISPRGGLERGGTLNFFGGTAHGAVLEILGAIPTKHNTTLDGNYFTTGWGGSHELKFGLGYRSDHSETTQTFGGNPGLLGVVVSPQVSLARVYRNGPVGFDSESFHAYVGDTFTKDRVTVNVGLRFDRRTADNAASGVPAQGTFPDLLPALDFPGGGAGIRWNELSPRVSATYALGESRRTVVRGSFARYGSRLNAAAATFDNPLGETYLTYLWNDLNGDKLPQGEEVLVDGPLLGFVNVDPANPGAAESIDTIDPDYSPQRDYEVIVGLDHELFPDFALSAAYTWRRITNTRRGATLLDLGWAPRVGLTSSDYIPGDPVAADGFTAQVFSPDPDLVAAGGGGRILGNRPDFHQSYNGLEVSLIKRLSNRWMMRTAFAYNDAREHYTGPGAVQNPTRTDDPASGGISGAQVDGGVMAPRSAGKSDVFQNGRWQVIANGLYELPAGFEVAGSLYGRQGYPRGIIMVLDAGLDGQLNVLASPEIDSERYPALWNLDLRLAKRLGLGGGRRLTLSLEMFNVFNSNTELIRNRVANAGVFRRLDEIISPRVLRFGAVLNF